MKRIAFIALAITLILSALCTSAFAQDDIETGLIPIVPDPSSETKSVLKLEEVPTKKTYSVGDELDLSGAKLLYTSSDGERYIRLEPSMVSGFDSSKPGKQVLTVTYNGLTATFEVEVTEKPAYIVGDVDGNGTVDSDDAIYLLFHTLFGGGYPVSQPVDYDSNKTVDSDDAIYLLFHTLFGDGYPLPQA